MTPRVTVLMTVYNGQPYLREAIDSVLAQTFRDFELLVVDDASQDGSLETIRAYRDPRIHVVAHASNMGQAASLNEGLRVARGEYVARLDQDDRCVATRLDRQAQALDERPELAVVGSWVYYSDASGRTTGVVGMRVENFGHLLGALLIGASPFGHPSVMFRRSMILDAGGYPEEFAPCEDYALWCRLAAIRRPAISLRTPLTMLRQHDGQQSTQRAARQRDRCQAAHLELLTRILGSEPSLELAAMLRADETFMTGRNASADVHAQLQPLLARLATMLTSVDEQRALRRRLAWWLGRSAFLGAFDRAPARLAMRRAATRIDPLAIRYPTMWLSPVAEVVGLVCPPSTRERIRRATAHVGRRRAAARLFHEQLARSPDAPSNGHAA